MSIIDLKKCTRTVESGQGEARSSVEAMMAELARDGDAAAPRLARESDKWQRHIVVSPEGRAHTGTLVSEKLKDDIRFAKMRPEDGPVDAISTNIMCESRRLPPRQK